MAGMLEFWDPGEMVRWALRCSPLFVGPSRRAGLEMAEPWGGGQGEGVANHPKCQTQIRSLY